MKKTILQVVGTMNYGGAETMLMDLLRKLHDTFHFVLLIQRKKGTHTTGDFDEELQQLHIPLYYIDAVWDIGPAAYEKQFRQVVQQIGQVDIVHSHLNSKGGIIARCAHRCGIKRIIVHSHAKLRFDGNFPHRFALNAELFLQKRWINRYATDYWGCSEAALDSLFSPSHAHSSQAQVIHNAIDVHRFTGFSGPCLHEELGLESGVPVIGSVGRIANVKNYAFAAQVITELWRRNFRCYYIVAGRKQDAECVQCLFSTMGNSKYFKYLGVRADVETLYHSMDIYLGSSKREGLGLSAVEAQACGVSCVLSTGFPEMCDVGLGLVSFVNSDLASDWAEAIIQAIRHRAVPTAHQIEMAIAESGFDICQEAARVKALYEGERDHGGTD